MQIRYKKTSNRTQTSWRSHVLISPSWWTSHLVVTPSFQAIPSTQIYGNLSKPGHSKLWIICQRNPEGYVIEIKLNHVFHLECILLCFPSNTSNVPIVQLCEDGAVQRETALGQYTTCPLCMVPITEDVMKHFSVYGIQKGNNTEKDRNVMPETKKSEIQKKTREGWKEGWRKKMAPDSHTDFDSGACPSA